MKKLDMYEDVGKYSEVLGASSQKQLELILAKAKLNIQNAIKALEHQDIQRKCEFIGKAYAIIEYLQSCVRIDIEGEVESGLAQRLNATFMYLQQQLFKANTDSDIKKLKEGDHSSIKMLEECAQIISNLHAWWEKVVELQ